jgi:hypothetical protein
VQGEQQGEPIKFPAEITRISFQSNGQVVAVGLANGRSVVPDT